MDSSEKGSFRNPRNQRVFYQINAKIHPPIAARFLSFLYDISLSTAMNESHDPNSTDWDIAQAQAPSPATEQKGATGKGRNLFTRQLAPILSGKRVDEDEERVVDPLDRNQGK